MSNCNPDNSNSFENLVEEMEKCKANPYYFFTKYITINGKPATTLLSEDQFNEIFLKIQNQK